MAGSKSGTEPETPAARPYHHGGLREAMLEVSERILDRDGISGLTLRAAAREAGASHAAPKNHFGDLTGLLSELAAVGFQRFSARLAAAAKAAPDPRARLVAIGRAYVDFASESPGLFRLMFRSERLDADRPHLRDAMSNAFSELADAVGATGGGGRLTLAGAADIVRAWALVHGFATLLLDGRLSQVLASMPNEATVGDLLAEVLTGPQKPVSESRAP